MTLRRSPVRGPAACAFAFVMALAVPVGSQVAAPGAQTRPAAPPRDQIAAAPTGTARISGRIVDADTGAPLRRVQVTLTGDQSVRRRVTTDGEGRYEITDLPPGRFTVNAAKGGYLTLQHGQRRPFEPGRPVAVGVAQVLGEVDLALPRASVITGRITDDRGEPVVGAEVRVDRYQYSPDGERRVTTASPVRMTNDLGEFRAFGLMPGEYVVSASVRQMPMPPGQAGPIGPAEGFLPTYYPGTTDLATAQSVPIGIGQEAVVQFGLVSGRLSRISGTIVDARGRPAAGASLMLATPSSNSIGASGRGSGTVAEDGSFSIGNISPGEHFIQVRLQARVDGANVSEVANVPILASGDDVTGIEIATSAGTVVAGRVEWDGSAPRTGGPATTPLRITATAANGRPALIGSIGSVDPAANGVIGRDDTFRIGGLMGPVLFTPIGVPPQWTLRAVIVDGADVTDAGIDTTLMGGDSQVRVVLTDKVTEISGSVRNARGERVPEYVVVLLPEEPVASLAAARYTRAVRPDQRGAFSIRALPPGRYLAVAVEALEQGTEWDPVFQAMVRPAARRVTLNDGQALTLDLDLIP